jgi:hypothetical protein
VAPVAPHPDSLLSNTPLWCSFQAPEKTQTPIPAFLVCVASFFQAMHYLVHVKGPLGMNNRSCTVATTEDIMPMARLHMIANTCSKEHPMALLLPLLNAQITIYKCTSVAVLCMYTRRREATP